MASSLRSIAIGLLVAFLSGACGAPSGDRREAMQSAPGSTTENRAKSVHSVVAVPDVVGLTEGEAVKALGAAGLIANVRYIDDAPRTGEVLHSEPEAGSELPADSVVVVSIAYRPRLPMPTPEQEQLPEAFSNLIEKSPEAFFGLYRNEAGVVVVVFAPGADPAAWEDRLASAAEGINYPAPGSGYRTDTCSRDRASLRAIQDEIADDQSWARDKPPPFGVWVQPETCTVRVESDLLEDAEIEALVDRYGTAISFDTSKGSHPVLLAQ
jgi:PASTA domain